MSIEKDVLKLISEQSGKPAYDLKGDDNRSDLGFDSLDDVEFIMALEEQFDIEIPDVHGEGLKTVRDVIDYVTSAI